MTAKKLTEEEIIKMVQEQIGKTLEPKDVKVEPEEKVVVKRKPVKVGAGQKKFSEVFGYVPETLPDFAVTVHPAGTFSSVVTAFIPPADDPELDGYVPQKGVFEVVVFGIENGDKVQISGPTGSGKSSAVAFACQKLQRPFVRINMNGDIESSALFGQLVVEDGATKWRDGGVTEGILHGAVVCIDEWEVMPPEIGMGFQRVLERGGMLFLKEKPGTSEDKMIKPHPATRFVFCGNTVGQGDDTGGFAGVAVQNTAMIDRFDISVHMDYLGADHEVAVITSKCKDVDAKLCKKLVQYASLIRSAYKQSSISLTMSPRTLINWAQKSVAYGDTKVGLQYAFLNKLRDSDKKIADEYYTKVFGK